MTDFQGTVSQKPPKLGWERPAICGLDIGNGGTKLVTSNHKINLISKVFEINEELLEIPQPMSDGAYFEYLNGDCLELKRKKYMTGSLAYLKSPYGHQSVVDDPENKVELGLLMLLGAIGCAPYQPNWDIKVSVSIHDSQVFGELLKKRLSGIHQVNYYQGISEIRVEVIKVLPEGAGAYAYALSSQLVKRGEQVISLDFGNGTTIINVIAKNGSLIYRNVLPGGVSGLIEAIARDKQMREACRGQIGDVELIRQAIEKNTFIYGNTDIEFSKLYQRHLSDWLKARLNTALGELLQWKNSTDKFLIWGGGACLPGLPEAVARAGFKCLLNPVWANAIGLQSITEKKCKS